ncbi:MAG: TerB family tellurite resistance protein [Rhodocyclaceae bacterium]|nr:TerB family tellurite resistance protein [Rhodocyclaceae bacterium]MBK6554688.1 TerB family tellurite resistance protein [Rhodocyclaceae bacterium]MBK9310033.1 TerB family tellurite resistance protein [Rhodocyclaceae bacterium]MBK9954891.1 TerB family tellurite resistance protein [Rhodocyclaceae bacterium]
MITIEDCKAFCDAPASHVEELACRECLPLVQAFARAHEMTRRNSRPVRKETAMMTMQARDMFPPRSGKTYPLRPYPANSPRAMARLVVLALLADGQLDERELAALERRGAFAALGISREDFVQVLYDFCADVARLSESAGGYRLSPALLSALFEEVSDPRAKERVMNLIVAVVSSDGRYTEGEQKLFLGALHAWGGSLRRGRPRDGFALRRHSLPPEAFYG